MTQMNITARGGLGVEQFEQRIVPSTTPTVDLTTRGAMGEVNGALFRQCDAQPTGTGYIDSFVRLQAQGAKQTVQQGYNTSARPLQFDENTSPQFTRSLKLSALPLVNIGGVQYREVLLDINQKAAQPLLSLDELQVFAGNYPDLRNYNTTTRQLSEMTAAYDLDAGGVDNWVKLNARLNQGSGKGDMLFYVPNSVFAAATAHGSDPYVYLFSKFGVNFAGNSGFEEWAAGKGLVATVTGGISGAVICTDMNMGVPDRVVFIDGNHNGFLDGDEVFDVTDSNGQYSFSSLAAGLGQYSVYDVRLLTDSATVSMSIALTLEHTTVTDANFYVSCSSNDEPAS